MNEFHSPDEKSIELFWSNVSDNGAGIDVVVTIPTFKRPEHLQTTLESVLSQSTDKNFAIVVMDNHPSGAEGANAAKQLLQEHSIPSSVILAHRRGNCAAYNAGFETALATFPDARWIMIIDDDEIARPGWIEKITQQAEKSNADFVGAPQHPIFEGSHSNRSAEHPVFRPPYEDSGPVPILYSSGNVLISADLLRKKGGPWLDERFNFLGGGDSDFYSRCKSEGASFAWAANAGVDETTPLRRTEISWLNSRSLRNGSISSLIQKKAATSLGDHAKRIVKTCLLLAASPYRSLILFVKTKSPTMALNPMNVALGRLLMEFGFANEQYKAADKN